MTDLEPQLAKKEFKQTHHDSGLSWVLIMLVLILLGLSVKIFSNSEVGYSPSPTPTATEPRQSRTYTVIYRAGVFSPTNLRIHAGDTVRFKNEGILPIKVASDPYPENNGLPGFDSIGDIPPGSFFAFTFATKGTFGYHNDKNPDETGTIIVR